MNDGVWRLYGNNHLTTQDIIWQPGALFLMNYRTKAMDGCLSLFYAITKLLHRPVQ